MRENVRDGSSSASTDTDANVRPPGKVTRTQRLPPAARARMEASTGQDLSDVRVNTGPESASEASRMDARAFTSGNDIHFGAGQYQPDDPFGMHLLAHEVAHTVQQRE